MIYINQSYTVKAGDTLYGISNQFGVSVTELAELNNIKGSNLSIGQVLIIPSNSGINPNNMFMYTVKSGDTLYGIARKYNTTVQEIMNLNYFKNNNLVVGQVIRIPEMYIPEEEMYPPEYINYYVKAGDTLYSIAANNGVDVNTIIKDNGLTSNNLVVGQILRLRVSDNYINIEECYGPDYTPSYSSTNVINYTVKSGDSLYKIARDYNTSVDNIIKLNNLTSNILLIGQQLIVPNNNTNILRINLTAQN